MSPLDAPSSSLPATWAVAADDLRVVRARALRGGNLWSRQPVIQADLRVGTLADRPIVEAVELVSPLDGALPGLSPLLAPPASVDATRVHGAPARWADLVARVASALQEAAGARAEPARVVLSAPRDDRFTIAVGYEEEALGMEAVHAAARLIRDLLRGDEPGLPATIAALHGLLVAHRPDPDARLIMAAARRRGIAIRRSHTDDAIQLGLGATQRRIQGAATERTSIIAARAASDPPALKRLLESVGVPVVRESHARSVEDAVAIAEDLGYPVRLLGDRTAAPASEVLADAAAVRAACARTAAERPIVEQVVSGQRYELLVVGGRLACAVVLDDEGTPGDCLASVHSQARALVELAAGVVGLDVAGVSVVTPTIDTPVARRSAVTAVEASPDLTRFAAAGGDPGEAVVEYLYPPGRPTSIPVIAVTGTNGKTTTTRLIAHLLRQTGRTVGFTTTDGVYLQEQLLMSGDLTGPFAANVVLSHRAVEAAVLETARGGILKSGLGFESCDVAVVMNVTADHLGLRGIETVEQLAEVKAVLPRAVRPGGWAVLNADDPLALAMGRDTAGRVALFSVTAGMRDGAVARHLAEGGVAALLEGTGATERLIVRDGASVVELGVASALPLAFGGHARFQLQNLLAAAAAAYVSGVSPEQIRAGLASFSPSTTVTPGRLNLLQTSRGQVLLDYAHNAAAVRGLFEFVRAMPATRRIALLSAPGDRRDEDLREIGRLASQLDVVIMKEHEVYRRGRAPGVVAEIMADGLRDTGFPAERLHTFVEEHDAVDFVMTLMQPGDVVIIIADDTAAVRRQLAPILREGVP